MMKSVSAAARNRMPSPMPPNPAPMMRRRVRVTMASLYGGPLRFASAPVSHASRQGIMRTIRGRKALVTGAASGIGRAIALALAREGADLFLLDIEADKVARVAAEARQHGVAATIEVCDLADSAAISAAVAALRAQWGALNILINNAGITFYGPSETMSA